MAKKKKKRKSPKGERLKHGTPGRPLLLTEAIHRMAVEEFARGGFAENIAASCGVTVASMRGWIRNGCKHKAALEAGEELTDNQMKLERFFTDVQRAKAQGIDACNSGIIEISNQDLDIKARFSALKYRLAIADRRYCERNLTELSGAEGGPLQIESAGSIGDAIKSALAAVPEIVLRSDEDA